MCAAAVNHDQCVRQLVKMADDGEKTIEFVSGRKKNHLHPPGSRSTLGGFSSSDRVPSDPDNAPEVKSSGRHQQQSDTGYNSQQSCSTTLNREGRVQTAFECTVSSCTADERSELVPGCFVIVRADRPPVGMRDLPLPRSLLLVDKERAGAEAGASATAALEK